MAFTFSSYASPELSKSPLNDIISNLFGGYEQGVKSRYLQPTLAEELKKQQLFNQYYGPNIESEMALRGAQTGQARAHTGLLNEQTNAARFRNKQLPEQLQYELEAKKLAAAQNAMFNQMLQRKIAESAGNINHLPSTPQYEPGQGNAPFLGQFEQPNVAQNYPGQSINQSIAPPQPTADDLFNKKFFGTDTFTERNKAQLANIYAQEKAFQAGLGKEKAKFYGDSVEAFNTLNAQDLALNELKNAVESNPQFRNVVGPIKSPIMSWIGNPEQKRLLGTLQSASGEIALQVAPALKGAFTGRDQTLINSIKAGPYDFPDKFIGKLSAQIIINSALKDRARIQAELVENGHSMLEASKLAAQQTPLEAFRPIVEKLINLPTPEGARAELARRRAKGSQ